MLGGGVRAAIGVGTYPPCARTDVDCNGAEMRDDAGGVADVAESDAWDGPLDSGSWSSAGAVGSVSTWDVTGTSGAGCKLGRSTFGASLMLTGGGDATSLVLGGASAMG